MSSNKVEWGEPPTPKGGRTSRYEWFYEALKENPGAFAKYPGSAGGATGYAQRHPKYDVTTRVVGEDGEQAAWMRYLPEGAKEEGADVGVEFEASDA